MTFFLWVRRVEIITKKDGYVVSTCIKDYYDAWSYFPVFLPCVSPCTLAEYLAMWLDLANDTQLAFCNHGFHIPGFNQLWIENFVFLNPRKFQKAKLECAIAPSTILNPHKWSEYRHTLLEHIYKYMLYANSTAFCRRYWSILRFGYPQGWILAPILHGCQGWLQLDFDYFKKSNRTLLIQKQFHFVLIISTAALLCPWLTV